MSEQAETLEQVLSNNYIEKLLDKQEQALSDTWPKTQEASKPIEDALKKDPEKFEKLRHIDLFSDGGADEAAKLLEISVEAIQAFIDVSIEAEQKVAGIIDYQELEETWLSLLPSTPIRLINQNDFNVETGDDAVIVFFSTDWCKPCKLRKPNFAKLSKFFDKANLLFTEDEELAKQEGVDAYPTFVAYLPNGTKVHSIVPIEPRKIWETMHNLITLGKSFEGEGTLVCTDTECKVEPF